MGGAVDTVVDVGAEILPHIISLEASVQSIEHGVWVCAAILFAFAFTYMAWRWL